MCYDDNAAPPSAPGANGEASGENVVLTAADSTQFAAYYAVGAETSAQVIIYPDVRGLHQFYKDLALQFAKTGVAAIAIDYFGRTAGLTSRDDSFEFWPHVQKMQLPSFTQDVEAALAFLHAKSLKSIFPVGFCMGGTMSLITGTNKALGFSGVIAFYAGLSRDIGGGGTALDQATKVVYPVLGLFGGADQGIPPEQVDELDTKLDETGQDHVIVTYPGAPHSFFDRKQAEFADASQDAWLKVLSFIDTHKVA
jgi:carboxymethylenebutenolidase